MRTKQVVGIALLSPIMLLAVAGYFVQYGAVEGAARLVLTLGVAWLVAVLVCWAIDA